MFGNGNFMKPLVALASLLVLLTGCVGVNYQVGTPPESDPNAYAPVEFPKLASGAFVAELDGKLVSLRCRFNQAFSQDGRSVEGRVSSPEPGAVGMVAVSFHDSLREKAISMKMGEIVTLRGKVRAVQSTHMLSGKAWTGNYLETYFIDP